MVDPNGAPPMDVMTFAPGTSAPAKTSTMQVFRSERITGTGKGFGTSITGTVCNDGSLVPSAVFWIALMVSPTPGCEVRGTQNSPGLKAVACPTLPPLARI